MPATVKGVKIMEFYIEKHSSLPAIAQIEEQVKLAVAMGIFRSGDTLPSIREVEKQTGVNRGKIHRAYLALRRSGLLALTRGRGTVIAAPAAPAASTNERCMRLSKSVISKARQIGVPPVVFARYLSRRAQEAERSEPFIAYVDSAEEVAERRAAEISSMWQIPVIDLTTTELKQAVRNGRVPRKVLVNHLRRDDVRSIIPNKRIDVIPIEVEYTEQTIEELGRIAANSSILRILAPDYADNASFIMAQLRKRMRSSGIRISWISVRDVSNFEKLLKGSQYDRVILDPGILGEVPEKLRRNPRILLVRLRLNPASLEAARIRAGVIL
jgi:DNA-binding transcriptional regulator YhcF (GntR family)